MKKVSGLILAALLLVGALGACSPAAQPAASVGDIAIYSPWARAADAGMATGVFMVIKNSGSQADKLVKAEYAKAMETSLHEMKMENDKMTMAPIDSLDVPANGQVELKSGSYHVMLMGLSDALKVGDTIPLTLTFEKAGQVTVNVTVRKVDE